MKTYSRIITVIFVATLLMVSMAKMIPMQTNAVEVMPSQNKISDEEFWSIVSEAFPMEYQRALSTPEPAAATYQRKDAVVRSQTKAISETEDVVYFEFESGRAGFLYSVDFINESSVSGSGYETISETICFSVTGYFGMAVINDFKYKIYSNAYDQILNPGSNSSDLVTVTTQSHALRESASGPATVSHVALMESNLLDNVYRYFQLYVYVGNNERTYDLFAA